MIKTYSVLNDTAAGVVDISKLSSEIGAADSDAGSGFSRITLDGDAITIDCPSLDEAALDAVVHAHNPQSLIALRAARCAAIDARTVVLIAGGFHYDGNWFSLSTQAQMNWSALYSMQALFTWPMNVTTFDNKQYALAFLNLVPFIAAGSSAVAGAVGSGRALKLAVNAATTAEQINAVVDTR